jgi:hypothetical protein
MKHIQASTPQDAYLKINELVLKNYEYTLNSRIGDCIEMQNISYTIDNPLEYEFSNEKINRIKYDYAEAFFNFMMSGGTNAQEAFKDYPQAIPFISPPKSSELPENFNGLYGPRIAHQLPKVLEELKQNPNTRRACVLILSEADNCLYGKDETIEYPCCFNITFSIRNGKLNSHFDMRSENTAIVLQLDLYLQCRVLIEVAKILDLPVGKISSNIVSAHIYNRDLKYIEEIIYG